MLRRLNEATNAQGMNLPGWGVHPLKGRDIKGLFSLWVSGNWRLTFLFEVTDAVLVDYQDYHRNRRSNDGTHVQPPAPWPDPAR